MDMKRIHEHEHVKTLAYAVLHKIGNQAPYFSLTGEIYERGRVTTAGCIHEELLAIWPDLAQLAALHLSTEDGVPMHALENARYFAGFTKYQEASPEKLSDHLRCGIEHAKGLIKLGDTAAFVAAVEAMKPRWKLEAEGVIETLGLQVLK
jgi:hypothetical protein